MISDIFSCPVTLSLRILQKKKFKNIFIIRNFNIHVLYNLQFIMMKVIPK